MHGARMQSCGPQPGHAKQSQNKSIVSATAISANTVISNPLRRRLRLWLRVHLVHLDER